MIQWILAILTEHITHQTHNKLSYTGVLMNIIKHHENHDVLFNENNRDAKIHTIAQA